jgi:hypothetical protein
LYTGLRGHFRREAPMSTREQQLLDFDWLRDDIESE